MDFKSLLRCSRTLLRLYSRTWVTDLHNDHGLYNSFRYLLTLKLEKTWARKQRERVTLFTEIHTVIVLRTESL